MLSEFITYIQQQELFRLSRDRVLLAVSGGIDSVAMVYLFKKAGVKFGIAHCNFQLRGAESDGDAIFVEQLAESMKVPFYKTCFETEKIADEQKKSIQVAARDLRYTWLDSIQNQHDYNYIAIAQHLNDSIETIFINLTMGCGIRGLHGILPKNGKIIRPLLFAKKTDIQEYIQQNKIAYREDSSNASTKYTRNAIRHSVIPELQKINPFLEKTFQENIEHFQATEALYNYAIQQLKNNVLTEKNNTIWIEIEGVEKSPTPMTLLYEILSVYNFKPSKIRTVFNRREENSGTIFSSATHQILKDRTHWILSPILNPEQTKNKVFTIEKMDATTGIFDAENFQIEWSISTEIPPFNDDKKSACLDFEKLHFPLQLRHWKDGDIFYPFGMNGQKKKLSKFFKDNKLNRFEKDEIWLLCDANDEIIWVLNSRQDERFKLDEKTKKILNLNIKKSK